MVNRVLSFLSWIGIALLLAAVAIRLGPSFGLGNVIKPSWDPYATYLFWAGVVLVVAYTAGQWREIASYFEKRNARYGALAGVSVVVGIGILIAVNYLAARQNKRWDLTANKRYSLSDQTIKILRGLDGPVKFVVFDRPTNFDTFRGRLNEYGYNSSKLQISYVDPAKDLIQARQYGVQKYGTVAVAYKDRIERATSDSEQDITNALIKVLTPQQKKVYFLLGHDEKDPTSSDERTGYSTIADSLKRDNFEFATLVLAQAREIPADATALIIAGPKVDLLDQEVTQIRAYLAKGGKLLVLLDPPEDLKNPKPMPNLTGLLKDWSINATNSIIVDGSGVTSDPLAAAAGPPYPAHAITENFNLLTVFPLARAMTPITGNGAKPAQSFIQTAARSWAETNLPSVENLETVAPEQDKGDIVGPVSLAVAVSVPVNAGADAKEASNAQKADEKKVETRVAAIGDSDFAANGFLGIPGNRDLFLNTTNWLVQQENLISIRPVDAADRRLVLTATQIRLTRWLIVVLPAMVLISGFVARRRRK
jgi:ABC-type uncharacterized transport system involved in gliding motility auxiliary subunit